MKYVAAIERIRSNCSTLFPDFLDIRQLAIAENKAIRKYPETLDAITHLSATKTGYFMVHIFQDFLAAFFVPNGKYVRSCHMLTCHVGRRIFTGHCTSRSCNAVWCLHFPARRKLEIQREKL